MQAEKNPRPNARKYWRQGKSWHEWLPSTMDVWKARRPRSAMLMGQQMFTKEGEKPAHPPLSQMLYRNKKIVKPIFENWTVQLHLTKSVQELFGKFKSTTRKTTKVQCELQELTSSKLVFPQTYNFKRASASQHARKPNKATNPITAYTIRQKHGGNKRRTCVVQSVS